MTCAVLITIIIMCSLFACVLYGILRTFKAAEIITAARYEGQQEQQEQQNSNDLIPDFCPCVTYSMRIFFIDGTVHTYHDVVSHSIKQNILIVHFTIEYLSIIPLAGVQRVICAMPETADTSYIYEGRRE